MTCKAIALVPSSKLTPADIMAASQRAHEIAQQDPAVRIIQVGEPLAPGAFELVTIPDTDPRNPEHILWPNKH